MSRVLDLINTLCPAGVEFRRVGDVARIRNGRDYKHLGDGDIPVYGSGGVIATVDTPAYTKPSVLIPRKGSLHKLYFVDVPFWTVDTIFYTEIGDELIPKFFYYYLLTQHIENLNQAGGVPSLTQSVLHELRMPVPPLDVQEEIVRTLDVFRSYEAALKAELEARRRQRLALTRILPDSARIRALSPSGSECVRIGDVAIQSVEPLRVQPEESYVNLGVRWYGEGAFARVSKPGSAIKGSTLYRVRPGQFIYNRMFVIEGSFGVITPELAGGVVSNEFPVYDLDHTRLLPGWLMLYLLDEYTLKRVATEVTGVERGSTKSRRRWKEEQFEAFEIDLPSIEAQREVLRLLGVGVALESALRKELTTRANQYEYYRDRLLTFEEIGVSVEAVA